MNNNTNKFVAVLDESLEKGVAMNILGHMGVAMGNSAEDFTGVDNFSDLSGNTHNAMAKYPFIVLKSSQEKIKEIYENAKNSKLSVIGAPTEVYTTYTDEEFVKQVAQKSSEEIQYFGVCLYGDAEKVNEFTGGLSLYK